MIEGVKEMKMHHDRRRVFVDRIVQSEAVLRESKFVGDCLHDAAISWGRLTFFIAIGLLLFAWPRLLAVDAPTLTAYVLTVLYLMSPLEQIIGWLPFLSWAAGSVAQIERLGLILNEEEAGTETLTPIPSWGQIELAGVTHAYQRDGQPHGFVLGPIDLTLRPGEIVFIIGGNGSGKTTLAKLITGLYMPESGQMQLGRPADHGGKPRGLSAALLRGV